MEEPKEAPFSHLRCQVSAAAAVSAVKGGETPPLRVAGLKLTAECCITAP